MGVFADCSARGMMPKEVYWPLDGAAGEELDPCSVPETVGSFPPFSIVVILVSSVSLCIQMIALWLAIESKADRAKSDRWRLVLKSLPNFVFTLSAVDFHIRLFATQVRYLQDLYTTYVQCFVFVSFWVAIHLHWEKFVNHTKKIMLREAVAAKQGDDVVLGGKILIYDPVKSMRRLLYLRIILSFYPLVAYFWLVKFGANNTRVVVVSVFWVILIFNGVPLLGYLALYAVPTIRNLKQMHQLAKDYDADRATIAHTRLRTFQAQVALFAVVISLLIVVAILLTFVRPVYMGYLSFIAAMSIGIPITTLAPALSKVIQLRTIKMVETRAKTRIAKTKPPSKQQTKVTPTSPPPPTKALF